MARSDGSDIELNKRQRIYDLQPELRAEYPLELPKGTLLFRCGDCGHIYPLTNFSRNSQRRYGIRANCRSCRRLERDPGRTEPDPDITAKDCPDCGTTLPIRAFYIDLHTQDGYSTRCRECARRRKQARVDARSHAEVAQRRHEQTLRLCGQLGIDYPGYHIKQCSRCEAVKHINEFVNQWDQADRKRSVCRDCHN